MGRIHLLDENTANKIAAGEVVERPAAVVKELVENALDAGANNITIQISGGGLEMIRVVDDGSGIAAEDVPLALQRHATSKIKTADDLSAVLSLGFRGEALPSIASVSRFCLVTRQADSLTGTEIIVHGGNIVRLEEAGCPVGTEVKVEDLFYNTPARLKFIKSAAAETARITAAVQRLALAWPEVAFTLTVNGKNKLVTPGSGQREDAVAQILGRQNMRQLLPVQWTGSLLTLEGFVSKPSLSRANRNLQYFFVNRRPIQSPLLLDALQTAYHTLLPRHRFPAAVLYLVLDPAAVDVNVHPTKREVRFTQERDLYRQLMAGVKAALKENSLIGELRAPSISSAWQEIAVHATQDELMPELVQRRKDDGGTHSSLPIFSPAVKVSEPPAAPTAAAGTAAKNNFPLLRPLGQYLATYILAQSDAGDLFLIDQHAAHERILYDAIKKDLSAGDLPVQSIIPQTFEFDAVTAARLQDTLNNFAALGLKFETFGNNTFILRSLPLFLKEIPSQEELVELLTQSKAEQDSMEIFEKTMQLMSCKAAIKANQTLDKTEMSTLLTNLSATTEPHTCPHGRPTVMVITAQTVARNFRRE